MWLIWHFHASISVLSRSLNEHSYQEDILHFRTISQFFPKSHLVGKWLENVPLVEPLHHFQPYSKSNLEAPDINMLCGVKRCPAANHAAYKCACEIINSFANLCQIENGTQMGFHTVHYLDCFARTELWICSVCATVSHLLCRQLLWSIQYVERRPAACWAAVHTHKHEPTKNRRSP